MGTNFGENAVTFDTPGPVLVHTGPCQVKGISAYNTLTTLAVLWIFDLGRVPILGVDIPKWQFPLAFNSTANTLTPSFDATYGSGLKCDYGLAYAICTTTSDAGSTAVSAHKVQGTIDWKAKT